MKAKHLVVMAMSAMMLASCGGKLPEGKDLKDLKNATTQDSVANLLGQAQAMSYWNMAQRDTLIADEAGRKAYIEGFLKGMDMLNDNEAYNAGLRSGLEAAMNMKNISKNYELQLSKEIYLQGMAYGMKSDSTVNATDLQKNMMSIGQRLEKQKQERDQKEAMKALDAAVKKDKLTKNGDYAYKMVKAGSGSALSNGTMVLTELKVANSKGKVLVPSMGAQPMEVGSPNLPQSVANVMQLMQPGSEALVVAPVATLGLGQADPAELAYVTIIVKGYCNEKGEPVTAPVTGPASKARLESANKVADKVATKPNGDAAPAKVDVKKAK